MNKKWIPLAAYNWLSNDYVLFAKMKKNGLISFKTKCLNSWWFYLVGKTQTNLAYDIPLNIKERWDILTGKDMGLTTLTDERRTK